METAPAKILVLQPATGRGPGLEIGLGIQRFWQKTLKHAGQPAMTLIAMTKVESVEGQVPAGLELATGDRGVAAIEAWDESAIAGIGAQHGSTLIVVPTLAVSPTGDRARLEARLVELGEAARASSWAHDGPAAELPGAALEILLGLAAKIGARLPWKTADDAYGTKDPGAALVLLEQLGILAMAEDGVRVKLEPVLARLALLAAAAPRSPPVLALVPELLGHLSRLGATDEALGAFMRAVRATAGVTPPEWDGLVGRISRGRNN